MKVDIIIPAYNCHETINRALASCAMQKLDEGDEFTVTIVDDASEKGYENIAQYWNAVMDVQLVNKTENAGCGQARQTGIDYTDGDYFMFLDADDTLASPVAVKMLLREMKKGDYDVVMGDFIEETAQGTFVMHKENWIWCHAKMYKRRTIDRFLLRFNLTRGNEDVGFHCVLKNLTDNTSYIPQVIYMWENCNTSLVRGDSSGYKCGYGWRDFVENMAWAAEELQSRRVNKALIRDHVVYALCRIYWQYEEAKAVLPAENDANWAKIKEYYKRAVLPLVSDGGIDYPFIASTMLKLKREGGTEHIIPKMTFNQYLTKLGFFKDLAKAEADYGNDS